MRVAVAQNKHSQTFFFFPQLIQFKAGSELRRRGRTLNLSERNPPRWSCPRFELLGVITVDFVNKIISPVTKLPGGCSYSRTKKNPNIASSIISSCKLIKIYLFSAEVLPLQSSAHVHTKGLKRNKQCPDWTDVYDSFLVYVNNNRLKMEMLATREAWIIKLFTRHKRILWCVMLEL